jgi:hypothetical protein
MRTSMYVTFKDRRLDHTDQICGSSFCAPLELLATQTTVCKSESGSLDTHFQYLSDESPPGIVLLSDASDCSQASNANIDLHLRYSAVIVTLHRWHPVFSSALFGGE